MFACWDFRPKVLPRASKTLGSTQSKQCITLEIFGQADSYIAPLNVTAARELNTLDNTFPIPLKVILQMDCGYAYAPDHHFSLSNIQSLGVPAHQRNLLSPFNFMIGAAFTPMSSFSANHSRESFQQ